MNQCSELKAFALPACPVIPNIVENMVVQSIKLAQKKQLEEIKERLKSVGYHFGSEAAFFDFCQEQITLVSYNSRPNYKEVWLDFDKKDRIMIAWYWDTVDVETVNSTLNVVVGNPPH
jgi:hypothetical protein